MTTFAQTFRLDELYIKRFSYWTLSVRPLQITLGALVVSLNRSCESLGLMTTEETAELAVVFRQIEQGLAQCFHYDKINYLALMMVDNQVHFHVLPRYNSSRLYQQRQFTDAYWPGPITTFNQGPADQPLLQQLVADLRQTFNNLG